MARRLNNVSGAADVSGNSTLPAGDGGQAGQSAAGFPPGFLPGFAAGFR